MGLSINSSAVILPEPRRLSLPNADRPLKLLLPSLKFLDRLGFFKFEELNSISSVSVLSLATTKWAMSLLQNGQTGGVMLAVVGFGLLWQHRARVQWAHIRCPQSRTSIVQTWSKHMQHNSVSLACTYSKLVNSFHSFKSND